MAASHHSVIPLIRAAILLASASGAGEEYVLQDGRSVK